MDRIWKKTIYLRDDSTVWQETTCINESLSLAFFTSYHAGIWFPAGLASGGEIWLANSDLDKVKPRPLIQNWSCELRSLMLLQWLLPHLQPLHYYFIIVHFPPVRLPKCAVRVFLVPSEMAGNKKGRLKVFFLSSPQPLWQLDGFYAAKMCLSLLSFFFLFPPSVFEGSRRHGRRKNGRVLDYYPSSTGDPLILRLCPLLSASSWSLGLTPTWSIASH